MKTSLVALAFASVAACTGGSGEPPIDAPTDAAKPLDAGPDARIGTMARVVPCPEVGTAGDVSYNAPLGYMPETTELLVGSLVRFHALGLHTADHVGGLWSASGDVDTCVSFDDRGTFAFRCYFHSEEQGTITVTY